ncbi:hypothetical protein [Micromonospora sp. RTGN7]|uniref:hypothetical protein n=1 Tax=Micromonospora sp. RTGN7 TaxID=3016526 RepID=UPI0029FF2D86|nr:hypothetical protein [Micromonospora sp. RTGN7]
MADCRQTGPYALTDTPALPMVEEESGGEETTMTDGLKHHPATQENRKALLMRRLSRHAEADRPQVSRMSEAEPDSSEHQLRRAAVHDFFHQALPLTACGLLHSAFVAYRPEPYDGEIDLVLSAEGRAAGPDETSAVVHGSADDYVQGWRDISGGPITVHSSGLDHMTMVGPGNVDTLAALCERLAG